MGNQQPSEMIEERSRGLGFGALATMNGVGDLISSVIIGFIWAFIGYTAGFVFATVIAAIGTVMLILTSYRKNPVTKGGEVVR